MCAARWRRVASPSRADRGRHSAMAALSALLYAPAMLPSHRELFEVPRDVAYLNNGAYTPLPRPVRAAGEAGVAEKSSPWTMDPAAITRRADAVREAAAGFIRASADDIAIV